MVLLWLVNIILTKISDGLLKIQYKLASNCDKYRSALEVIKLILDTKCSIVSNAEAVGIINEVLNEG